MHLSSATQLPCSYRQQGREKGQENINTSIGPGERYKDEQKEAIRIGGKSEMTSLGGL